MATVSLALLDRGHLVDRNSNPMQRVSYAVVREFEGIRTPRHARRRRRQEPERPVACRIAPERPGALNCVEAAAGLYREGGRLGTTRSERRLGSKRRAKQSGMRACHEERLMTGLGDPGIGGSILTRQKRTPWDLQTAADERSRLADRGVGLSDGVGGGSGESLERRESVISDTARDRGDHRRAHEAVRGQPRSEQAPLRRYRRTTRADEPPPPPPTTPNPHPPPPPPPPPQGCRRGGRARRRDGHRAGVRRRNRPLRRRRASPRRGRGSRASPPSAGATTDGSPPSSGCSSSRGGRAVSTLRPTRRAARAV